PMYEYRCLDCRKTFGVFLTYQEYGQKAIVCRHCQSAHVQRRIGRIRVARSGEQRMDEFSDANSFSGLEDDPRALGRMMRKMSGELGEDMGPEFNEVVHRLERGQSTEEIERELPDLGMGNEGSASGGAEDDLDY
ncbi:MAG: FmdB family zinc ribbon protein, partial [Anaerolineaceae bacterium]|nr:FmdB family zinc ribbon protein [Anaerolineaceae bacterium]